MGVLDDLEKLWSLGAGFAKDATTGQAFDAAKARAEPRPNPHVEREPEVVDAEFTQAFAANAKHHFMFQCHCGQSFHGLQSYHQLGQYLTEHLGKCRYARDFLIAQAP